MASSECKSIIKLLLWLIDWKKRKKILQHTFLSKLAVVVTLKKLSSNTIFRWCTCGKFNYFCGKANKVKWGLKYFWLTTLCRGYLKYFWNVVSPAVHCPVQSRQDAISIFPSSSNIHMIYLHITESCLKVTIAVLFLSFKNSFNFSEKCF